MEQTIGWIVIAAECFALGALSMYVYMSDSVRYWKQESKLKGILINSLINVNNGLLEQLKETPTVSPIQIKKI